jgi:hypothetical protein
MRRKTELEVLGVLDLLAASARMSRSPWNFATAIL